MHPDIIFAKFQIHANVIPRRTETRERKEQACDAVWCHSNAVSFYYLWYGAIQTTVYR